MNSIIPSKRTASTLVAMGVATALLAACASTPPAPSGAAAVRARLTALQADAHLASRAPVAVREADTAVRLAEMSQPDKQLAGHRVVIADRKVETARALAETEFAESERTALTEQRERARLDARTREADAARMQTRIAEDAGAQQKLAAEQARSAADTAQQAAADSQQAAVESRQQVVESRQQVVDSRQQSAELQRQLDAMHARVTERGVVLTLGDVLFTSGRAELKSGATVNLDRLAAFLTRYPERTAMIEGFTDNLGSQDYNQGLSEQRAESVKGYLTGRGVETERLATAGRGERDPVADNDSAAGRQQNRRVQVVIGETSNAPR
jgi:outer membrane protein OmpA-like peptidoglycan-associated protein